MSCVKYEAAPLTKGGVNQALLPVSQENLRVAVASIKHLILKPMQIDLLAGLTPDEVAVVAVVVNPSLRAERDQAAIAAAQLVQAGLLPNPQLTANLDLPVSSNPPDTFRAYGLGVNWDITSLIGQNERKSAAASDAASVALDVAWQEWQVAQAAKIAAQKVLSTQAEISLAIELDTALNKLRDLIRQAVDAHQKTSLELAAADAAWLETHSTLLQLNRELADEQLELNKAIGLPPDTVIKLKANDSNPMLKIDTLYNDLSQNLEDHRLDLLALKKGYDSQDSTLRAAILSQFPKINIGFSGARDTSKVHTASLGISIDLPIFDRNQAVIAEEKATRQKLFDEYTNRVFEARSDLAVAIADIKALREQIQFAEQSLPALENLATSYQSAANAHNADVLSYFEAQKSVIEKKIDTIKLRQELAELYVALEIASGQSLSPVQEIQKP